MAITHDIRSGMQVLGSAAPTRESWTSDDGVAAASPAAMGGRPAG